MSARKTKFLPLLILIEKDEDDFSEEASKNIQE